MRSADPDNELDEVRVLLGLPDPPPTTVPVDVVARAWGCSTWAVYQGARRGELPVLPLRVGRTMRWPTLAVLRSLAPVNGEGPAAEAGPSEVTRLDASRNGDRGPA